MTHLTSSEFVPKVDHAAAMNDRWLFLEALGLPLAGCGLVPILSSDRFIPNPRS